MFLLQVIKNTELRDPSMTFVPRFVEVSSAGSKVEMGHTHIHRKTHAVISSAIFSLKKLSILMFYVLMLFFCSFLSSEWLQPSSF